MRSAADFETPNNGASCRNVRFVRLHDAEPTPPTWRTAPRSAQRTAQTTSDHLLRSAHPCPANAPTAHRFRDNLYRTVTHLGSGLESDLFSRSCSWVGQCEALEWILSRGHTARKRPSHSACHHC